MLWKAFSCHRFYRSMPFFSMFFHWQESFCHFQFNLNLSQYDFLGGFDKQALVAERADRQIIFLQHKLMQLNVTNRSVAYLKSKTVFTWRFPETPQWGIVCCVSVVSIKNYDDSKVLGLRWNPLVWYSLTTL